MNILITCDDNYLFPARVCCQSVIQNHPNTELYFYVMHLESECKIVPFLKKQFPDKNIIDIVIPDAITNCIRIPRKYNAHVTIATYFRLFVIKYIPVNVDRILYMDVDAFCNRNFESIYSIDFKGNYIAGCYDYGFDLRPDVKREVFSNLGLKDDTKYVNGGVLLFNLSQIRKDYKQEDIIMFMKRIEDKILFHDQDILNSFFLGRILIMPKEMNMRPFHYSYNVINSRYLCRKAYIIHYGQKPWNEKFTDMAWEVYWKYARIVEGEQGYIIWKKKNKEFKKLNRYNIFKTRIKRNINVFKFLSLKGKMSYYHI